MPDSPGGQIGVDSTAGEYDDRVAEWQLCRDCYRGETAIKTRQGGQKYLLPTTGMMLDGMQPIPFPLASPNVPRGSVGYINYRNYLMRARFPGLMQKAITKNLGVLWQHGPQVKLPSAMEYLIDNATQDGQSLNHVLLGIHKELMTTGRMGLYADMPSVETKNPAAFYICSYPAEKITNWDVDSRTNKTNLVVLKESYMKRVDGFRRTQVDKYRVLSLGPVEAPTPDGPYLTGTFERTVEAQTQANPQPHDPAFVATSEMTAPYYLNKTIDFLPFVFVNQKDLTPCTDNPPLLDLSRISLSLYRQYADYYQSLWMSGQDTLVIEGDLDEEDQGVSMTVSGKNKRVGAGSRIMLPMGGSAYYIGISGKGLAEQGKSISQLLMEGKAESGELQATSTKERESGDALQTKAGSQTATLKQIANIAAEGLQMVLRYIAKWMGLDPLEVIITANTDFTDAPIDAGVLLALWTMKKEGGPVTNEDLHRYLHDHGVTDKTIEDVMAELEKDKKAIEDAAQEDPKLELAAASNAAKGVGAQTRSKNTQPKKGVPSK